MGITTSLARLLLLGRRGRRGSLAAAVDADADALPVTTAVEQAVGVADVGVLLGRRGVAGVQGGG